MTNQHRLPFQDPEPVTRRPAVNVVHAHVESVADFNESYFAGYNVFRALTYTSSISMVANLLRQHDFDDFECIFGHNGILSREAEEILAFQAVVREKLATGLLGLKRVSAERRELIYNRIAEGTADALHPSSTTLCALFEENLPPGMALPYWCAPMTLSEYQKRAFERPRLILDGMLSTDRYSPERLHQNAPGPSSATG